MKRSFEVARLHWLRGPAVAILAALLVSCAQEVVDWIDIPLADNVYFEVRPQFNSDVVEIPLSAHTALEFNLQMQQGAAISYEWEALNLPEAELLLSEFHGHTVRTSEAPGDLMFYKISRVASSEGYLVAPFEGIHAWYFSNESDEDINIVLSISGFYNIAE